MNVSVRNIMSVLSVGLAIALSGCQRTTSTGPTTDSKGQPTEKKLAVVAATHQTIKRGDSDEITVTISRSHFDDPVTIKLNNLPQGVDVADKSVVVPSGSNSAKVKLSAKDDAPVGDFKIDIVSTAPGLNDNVQTFTLTVKDKG